MLVTWTVLRCAPPTRTVPWTPVGASWWDAGHSSPGRASAPDADGAWWSVVATWDDAVAAEDGPPCSEAVETWHLVLRAVSSSGDVVLSAGARPFEALPTGEPLDGPVALLTVAGQSPDSGREREFFRRFLHVSRDVDGAPGHLVSLVHAPPGGDGPVLTLSVWQDLDAGLAWAYTVSRAHTSAVARQRTHGLVRTSGSVRCAVRSSTGTLAGRPDPLSASRSPSPASAG